MNRLTLGGRFNAGINGGTGTEDRCDQDAGENPIGCELINTLTDDGEGEKCAFDPTGLE